MSDNNGLTVLETKEIFQDKKNEAEVQGLAGLLGYLAAVGELVPPWWSFARDKFLRNFAKEEDHLSGTVNTLAEMMTAIPVKVTAKNNAIKSHVAQADKWTAWLMTNVESRSNHVSTGWTYFFSALMRDYHTTDNGAFFAVEGPGRGDGPLTGMPTKLIHLDSLKCQRTRSREFPVIFTDSDGKRYKLHHSRVVALTSASDPDSDMLGVGLCAVSRAIHIAQEFMDIARYKGEKLGSRRRRAILFGDGVPAKAIQDALGVGDEMMDNMGLSRYGMIPILGSNKSGNRLELIDLSSLPDGFNEMENAQLGMSVLALAFGVDLRQLAFAFSVTGQTKADAEIQNQKMWGKGPGYIIQQVKEQFAAKVLPDHLQLEFDYQDDGQDKLVSEIKFKRAERRKLDIETEAINVRTIREQMLQDGDITDAQFEQLELEDGRLEDGSDILTLFFSKDTELASLLTLGVSNPLVISQNEPDTILPMIDAQILVAMDLTLNAPSASGRTKARLAEYALRKLRGSYEEQQNKQKVEEQFQQQLEQGGFNGNNERMAEGRNRGDDSQAGNGGNQRSNNRSGSKGTRPTAGTVGDTSKKKELWYKQSEDELETYQNELASLIEDGTNGDISESEFESNVEEITAAILLLLFLRGAGLSEDELSEDERKALEAEIGLATKQVPELASDVYSGKFTSEGGNDILSRVALWVGFAGSVYVLGQLFKRDDATLRWDIMPGKDHCGDCLGNDGKVMRRSEWRQSGFWPKSRSLACGGFRCGCSLTEV